ncbi:hypothetical protein OQA88_7369 [Cercophora sp. LCS_1]
MANNSILTNEYVAGLLVKEAGDASIKYSSMGLEAFRSAKPANKAKPNTRFLNRIIKETTNHNAALLAKETAEAQARLNDLTSAEDKKRRKLNLTAKDIRERQLGNISSILMGGRKRKHDEPRENKRLGESESNKGESGHEGRKEREGQCKDDKDERARTRDRRSSRKEEDRRDRRQRDRSRSPTSHSSRHRHRSPLSGDDSGHDERNQTRRRHGKEKESPRRDLISGDISKRKKHGRLSYDQDDASRAPSKDLMQCASSNTTGRLMEHDSPDPDEDFGPALPSKSPIRRRGRGAARGPSAMDSRFSDNYDPQSDTRVGEGEDDWDEAVEMYRDRQKWKQQGADKLRGVGFTDDQINKLGEGGEKDVGDVRWSKAGERRKWDQGKED